MAQLQLLYARIIWDALCQRPIVLLLDDVHKMDVDSVAVFADVARWAGEAKLKPDPVDNSTEPRRPHGVVVCTTCLPLTIPSQHSGTDDDDDDNMESTTAGLGRSKDGDPMEEELFHELPGVTRILLAPLVDEAVVEISKLTLQTKSLADSIAAAIIGKH
jgi:hypothetical protein